MQNSSMNLDFPKGMAVLHVVLHEDTYRLKNNFVHLFLVLLFLIRFPTES
jgi:hypothetical protein